MSEWAYRNCTCGNRVHINFTCDKCDGDPWGVRTAIKRSITILEKEKERVESLLINIKNDLKDMKSSLKKSYTKKKKKV